MSELKHIYIKDSIKRIVLAFLIYTGIIIIGNFISKPGNDTISISETYIGIIIVTIYSILAVLYTVLRKYNKFISDNKVDTGNIGFKEAERIDTYIYRCKNKIVCIGNYGKYNKQLLVFNIDDIEYIEFVQSTHRLIGLEVTIKLNSKEYVQVEHLNYYNNGVKVSRQEGDLLWY